MERASKMNSSVTCFGWVKEKKLVCRNLMIKKMKKLVEKECDRRDSRRIRALANAYGIRYQGPFGLPFFRDRTTCAKMIALSPTDFFDVEAALEVFQNKITGGRGGGGKGGGQSSAYAGFAEAAIFGLIYLKKRNPASCCIVVSQFQNLANQLARVPRLSSVKWHEVGLVWKDDRLEGVSQAFAASVRKCSGAKRFVVFLLTLVSPKHTHANIVLWDTFLHVGERFDPYQVQFEGTDNLDHELELFFKELDPTFSRLIRPPSVRFYEGLQHLQEKEQAAMGGYCQPWCFMYADCRMTFPDQSPDAIRELILRAAQNNLSEFVQNYASVLHNSTLLLFMEYLKHENDIYRDHRVPLIEIALRELVSVEASI